MLNWLHKIIHKKKQKVQNIEHIIEDDIFPLQALLYSIEKIK